MNTSATKTIASTKRTILPDGKVELRFELASARSAFEIFGPNGERLEKMKGKLREFFAKKVLVREEFAKRDAMETFEELMGENPLLVPEEYERMVAKDEKGVQERMRVEYAKMDLYVQLGNDFMPSGKKRFNGARRSCRRVRLPRRRRGSM
jgi:hypothetical protein